MFYQPINQVLCYQFVELIFIFQFLFFSLYYVFLTNSYFLSYPCVILSMSSINTFVLVFYMFSSNWLDPYFVINLFFNSNNINLGSSLFKLLLIVATIIVTVINSSYLSLNSFFYYEYELLVFSSFLALLLLLSCNDFITLYLCIELQSLSFYCLVAINMNSELSIEASINYFILGSVASCFLLYGITMIYCSFGTISLDNIVLLSNLDNTSGFSVTGLLFLLVLFLFKLGVAPFHYWVTDVYEASLTSLTIFFSSIPNIVYVFLLSKLFYITFAHLYNYWMVILWLSGAISLVLANFGALYQRRLNRLLAYSAISQTGLLCLSLSSFSVFSLNSVGIFIVPYILMTIGSFALLILASGQYYPKYLLNWLLVNQNNLPLSLIFALNFFSLAGIPPLAGFYINFNIMLSLIEQFNYFTLGFVVIISCISAFYYISIINIVLFTKTYKDASWFMPICHIVSAFCFLITCFIAVFICYPLSLEFFTLLVYLSVIL